MSKIEKNLGLVKLLYEQLTDAQKAEIKGVDGESIDFRWDGTRLGVKNSSDTEYLYQDLAPTEAEVISLLRDIRLRHAIEVVDELPDEGMEDSIYLIANTEDNIHTTLTALRSDLTDLTNNVYTKGEVDSLTTIIHKVNSLPVTGTVNELYFVSTGNGYNIYAYVDDLWVKINEDTRLSEYATSSDVESIVSDLLSERDYNVVDDLPVDGNENTLYFVHTENDEIEV